MAPKPRRHLPAASAWAAAAAACLLAGCATPGPNHLYSLTPAAADIADRRTEDGQVVRLASHLLPAERAMGVAYDRNTDHLFVRVAPGDLIKVIERPSGQLFGTITLESGATAGLLADLAIRSDDRNLFSLGEGGRAILESRLDGRRVRTEALSPEIGPAGGVAVDQRTGTLLLLVAAPRGPVIVLDEDFREVRRFGLDTVVAPTALAHDEASGHSYIPLPGGDVGEFDDFGKLVRVHPGAAASGPLLLDAGQRSYVRVF